MDMTRRINRLFNCFSN